VSTEPFSLVDAVIASAQKNARKQTRSLSNHGEQVVMEVEGKRQLAAAVRAAAGCPDHVLILLHRKGDKITRYRIAANMSEERAQAIARKIDRARSAYFD
jgi:macrodomain Ter protein organizer (MatP/YcbG family)